MTSIDPASDIASRRRSRFETLRLWRDGALTLAAFGLVASLVFGTLATTRHDGAAALWADAALTR